MPPRPRTLPPGFVPPCLPTKAPRPPTGDAGLHEIKHDGFLVVARKDSGRVRSTPRQRPDPPVHADRGVLARLRSRSCIIDGEAVCCDDKVRRSFISGWLQRHRIPIVWACGYNVILRHCRVRWAATPTRHLAATRRPGASHLIRVHDLASLEVTRATHPGSLLITQSVPIPRESAVRASKRH